MQVSIFKGCLHRGACIEANSLIEKSHIHTEIIQERCRTVRAPMFRFLQFFVDIGVSTLSV